MASAVVVGATGILGREIVWQLSQNPAKWKTIYAISRSKKEDYPSNVVHTHIDLLSSADQMAEDLKGVEAEYIFFAAYLQKDTEEENWQVNGDMLQNFLRALELTSAVARTKRVLLVTGCKQYGVHLGQPKNPMVETDPWLRDSPPFPPNFYYRQQDILRDFCARHAHTAWTVTYPNDVIGFAQGNFMNLATTLGLYAAVTKELQLRAKGREAEAEGQAEAGDEQPAELRFPGSETFYTRFDCFTSSRLHARFCEWAATEPRAANQAFNVVDGDVQSWQDMWPRLARRFGMRVPADQFAPDSRSPGVSADLAGRTELGPHPPPISVVADAAGLRGRIGPSALEQRVSLAKWSGRDEVRRAWARLAEREGLQRDAFDKATWAFADFVLGRSYDIVVSMSKAREAGWTGYQDTWKALSDVFGELEAANVLPKIH